MAGVLSEQEPAAQRGGEGRGGEEEGKRSREDERMRGGKERRGGEEKGRGGEQRAESSARCGALKLIAHLCPGDHAMCTCPLWVNIAAVKPG